MGRYNDIWTRVDQYDQNEKARKRKSREEKRKLREDKRKNEELDIPQVEDLSLNDEIVEGEEQPSVLWKTTDFKIIKSVKS